MIGPRTGAKTPSLTIPAAMPPDLPALATRVAHVESLRPGLTVRLAQGGAFHIWREITDGASEVAETTLGGAAAVRRAGRLRYLCGWPDYAGDAPADGRVRRRSRPARLDLPEGLRRTETAGEVFWFNYTTKPLPLAADRRRPVAPRHPRPDRPPPAGQVLTARDARGRRKLRCVSRSHPSRARRTSPTGSRSAR